MIPSYQKISLPDSNDTFFSGGFVDYILDRYDVQPIWHEYTHHEFVHKMGDGTLPPDVFKDYMIQDYLYLVSKCKYLTIEVDCMLIVLRYNSPEPILSLVTRQRISTTSPV